MHNMEHCLLSTGTAGILVALLNVMSRQGYEQPSYICTFSMAAHIYSLSSTVPGTAVSLYVVLKTFFNITHTHIQLFNVPLSGTTWVGRYQMIVK